MTPIRGNASGNGLWRCRVWVGMLVLLGLTALAATVGRYPIDLATLSGLLWDAVSGDLSPGADAELPDTAALVLFDIRLPRLLAALLVGAALASAGATYQTVFRNPLVSPDILGVSAGAGLGAVLAIYLSLPVPAIQAMAFGFGLLAVGIVYLLARLVRGGHDPILVLVLAGVVIGSVMGACISILTFLADPYDQLPAITFWLMGSLSGLVYQDLSGAWPMVLAGLVPLVLMRWRVNLMTLGDAEARALGVETGRMRLALVVCATLMTSSVVAISGTVGWVGLIVPHMARFLVGPEFTRLLPASLLLGAGYVLVVDTIARGATQIDIPIGILNALIGAPVFLWILASARRSWR